MAQRRVGHAARPARRVAEAACVSWGRARHAPVPGAPPRPPSVRRYRFTSLQDWFTDDDAVLSSVDRRMRRSFTELPKMAADEAQFTEELYQLLCVILKQDATAPAAKPAVEWAAYLDYEDADEVAGDQGRGGAAGGAAHNATAPEASSRVAPVEDDTDGPVREPGGDELMDGFLRDIQSKGNVVARAAPTREEEDLDRKNAYALRKKFQHIRTVSERLKVAKRVVATLNTMRTKSYIGIQTYRIAFLVLSRISRGSTISTVYERMKLDGVMPDQKMFNLILGVWSKRSLEQTRYFLSEMIRLGLAGNYIHHGGNIRVLLAQVVHAVAFAQDAPREERHAAVRWGRVQEVLAIAGAHGVAVKEAAYLPLIMLAGSYEEGLAVLRDMLRSAHVEITPRSVDAVLQLCVATGSPGKAEHFLSLLADMRFPVGAPQWRALLRCYEAVGEYDNVLAAWGRMEAAGVVPTSQAYDILLRTHLARVRPSDAAMEINGSRESDAVDAVGFQAQFRVNAAVQAAKRAFGTAVREHGHAGAPNLWNSMLEIYVAAQQEDAAVEHLAWMKKAGLPANARCRALYERLTGTPMKGWQTLGNIEDDLTLAHYLRVRYKMPSKNAEYALRRRPALARRYTRALARDVEEYSVYYGPNAASICVKLLAAAGELTTARSHFDSFVRDFPNATPEEVTDAAVAMMGGYTQARDIDKVMEVWRACRELGGRPGPLVCAQVLWGLTKAGARGARVRALAEGMRAAGIELPENAVIAVVSACGTFHEADDVLTTFGVGITPPVVGAVLKACAREKNTTAARDIFANLEQGGGARGDAPRARGREWVSLMNVYKEVGDIAGLLDVQRAMAGVTPAPEDIDTSVVQNIVVECVRTAIRNIQRDESTAGVPWPEDTRALYLSVTTHALAQLAGPFEGTLRDDARRTVATAGRIYATLQAPPSEVYSALRTELGLPCSTAATSNAPHTDDAARAEAGIVRAPDTPAVPSSGDPPLPRRRPKRKPLRRRYRRKHIADSSPHTKTRRARRGAGAGKKQRKPQDAYATAANDMAAVAGPKEEWLPLKASDM